MRKFLSVIDGTKLSERFDAMCVYTREVKYGKLDV